MTVNGNELWKRVAIALLSAVAMLVVNQLALQSEKRGSSTGWSKDQEQRFLEMPQHIDSAWVTGIRERAIIIEKLDKILFLLNGNDK